MTTTRQKRHFENDISHNTQNMFTKKVKTDQSSKHSDDGVFKLMNAQNLRNSPSYEKAWKSYFHHPIVIECRELLTNGVIGNGVTLRQKSDTRRGTCLNITDSLNMILCNYYERAARNALSWLFVTGIVPVYFELLHKDENVGVCWVPVVPDYDSVDILVYPVQWNKDTKCNSHSRVTYKCITKQEDSIFKPFTDQDETENSLHFSVMQFSVHTPTASGELITPLASCVQFLDEISYLRELKYKAEFVRANPPVMVSHIPPSRRINTTDVMPNIDMVAGVASEIAHDDMLEKVRVEYIEDMPFTSSMNKSGHSEPLFNQDVLLRNAAMHKEEARKQFTFLPRDHTYVHQHLPSVPEDYCRLVSEHEYKIRKILGFHNNASSKGNNEHGAGLAPKKHKSEYHDSQNMNMAMINRYRCDINEFLKRCFSISKHLNIQSAENKHLQSYEEKQQPSNDACQIYDQFSSLPDSTTVVLKTSPFVNSRMLELASEHDLIDKETLRSIILDVVDASI